MFIFSTSFYFLFSLSILLFGIKKKKEEKKENGKETGKHVQRASKRVHILTRDLFFPDSYRNTKPSKKPK